MIWIERVCFFEGEGALKTLLQMFNIILGLKH